jgi:hypothetical protein|tara:strand:+ start:2024 stop:2836 length:813 start_codon:yes stop_codon:yes gene_type:complete
MTLTKKRGKLSNGETDYIRQNCFELSIAEIAEELNRTEAPVRKFIDKENLKARDLTDEEHLLVNLRKRYYFHELQKQFGHSEIIFFEHQWIDYFRQFTEDVTHTEEMQILEVIRTEVLINRGMEDRQDVVQNVGRLNSLIDEEIRKPPAMQDTQAIASFQTQLGAAMASKSAYINEHEKLLTKKERLLKDLKGTREQRKRNAADAKTNFSAWLKQLDDEEFRKREEQSMEVNRLASIKAIEKLSDYHTYEDGSVDQPFLNADTVKDEDID